MKFPGAPVPASRQSRQRSRKKGEPGKVSDSLTGPLLEEYWHELVSRAWSRDEVDAAAVLL